MTLDEQHESAEGLAEFRFADQVAPSEVLAAYAEKAYEATPALEGEPMVNWKDPRAARFRRAVAAEVNRKGKAKRRALEAEAKVKALQSRLDDLVEAAERQLDEYEALKERFREVYVELHLMKSREAAAASGGTTLANDSEGGVSGSAALGTDPDDPEGEVQ